MINVPPILSTRDIYDVQAQTSDIIAEVQAERRESRLLIVHLILIASRPLAFPDILNWVFHQNALRIPVRCESLNKYIQYTHTSIYAKRSSLV